MVKIKTIVFISILYVTFFSPLFLQNYLYSQKFVGVSPIDERHRSLIDSLELCPNSQRINFQLGLSYFINQFHRGLGLPPLMIFGGPEHVTYYERQEYLLVAEKYFRKANELDGEYKDASTYYLAAVKLYKNRYGPVVVFIDNLLNDNPSHKYAIYLKQMLGIAYRQMHEYELALNILSDLNEQIIELKHHNIAIIYLLKGTPQKALSELSKGLEVYKDDTFSLLEQAIKNEINGQIESAIYLYEVIARSNRKNLRHYFLSMNMEFRIHTLKQKTKGK